MARAGNLAKALDQIRQLVVAVISRESSWAAVFSSPDLDRLCLELGRLNRLPSVSPVNQEQIVFLATGLSRLGGHTRVLLDLIAADPGRKVTVLITNVHHELPRDEYDEIIDTSRADVELAPDENLALRLGWLQQRLSELRPARTYILQHHFDPVIVAAAQPELVGQLFYYHNCDHSLALGVHIPHAVHVDFNGKGFHHCRSVKGVRNNVYWPLVAEVNEYRQPDSFMRDGHIVTATSGGSEKFTSEHLIDQAPYVLSYPAIVPRILRATGGTHIHIGPLATEVQSDVADQLKDCGIEPQRFIHVPWVGDLSGEIVQRRVDLYIGSFPRGGGRAVVEIMGAGVPMLLHSNYSSVFFSDVADVYPGVLQWRWPNELDQVLGGITAELLADHSVRARARYEAHHRPSLLKSAISATLLGKTVPAPEAPAHFPDLLQRYLDRLIGDEERFQARLDHEIHLRLQAVADPPPPVVAPVLRVETVDAARSIVNNVPTKYLGTIALQRILSRIRNLRP